MKTLFTLFFTVGFILLASAQNINKQVVASAGNTTSNASNQLTSTIGEPIIGLRGATVTINQGFLAGVSTNETLSIETLANSPSVKLFPNPVTEIMHVSIPNNSGNVTATIYDITGKEVAKHLIDNELKTINLKNLSNGMYLVQLHFKENKTQKSFKIIKK